MIFRILPIIAITLGSLAVSKIAKAQVSQLKGKQPLTNLEGSEWGPENGMGQFVMFRGNGEMSGFAGCNSFFGTYEQTDNTIKIGALAMTRKMCAENMGAEHAFIAALENARTFKASHLEINIMDADGEVALSMRRRDWD